MTVLYIIIAISAILFINGIYQLARSGVKQAAQNYYHLNNKLFYKGMDSSNVNLVRSYAAELEREFQGIKNDIPQVSRKCFQEDIDDLKSHADSLELERWEDKAGAVLDRFAELFYIIIDSDFSDVELAYRAKSKCINAWYRYWGTVEDVSVTVYPKEFMKSYLGEAYDPCMEARDALEQKLDAAINAIRPEYKRKMKLFDNILDTVHMESSIMRSDLLKRSFPNSTRKEVEICYRDLVRRDKLVEVKQGSRYFVSLSDKELERRSK
jgi:hypothetical protein